jgi:hypothetical protein
MFEVIKPSRNEMNLKVVNLLKFSEKYKFHPSSVGDEPLTSKLWGCFHTFKDLLTLGCRSPGFIRVSPGFQSSPGKIFNLTEFSEEKNGQPV